MNFQLHLTKVRFQGELTKVIETIIAKPNL